MNQDIIQKTLRSLETSLAKHPDNVQVMTSLAEIYLKCDILGPRTLQLLERLSELVPDNHRIHHPLSICYLIHQPTEMASNLQTLKGIDTQALMETKNRLEALNTQHSLSADLQKALGDIALFLRNPEEGAAYYKEAVNLGFRDYPLILRSFTLAHRSYDLSPSALNFFASIYHKIGLTEKAADIYRMAYENNPTNAEAKNWLINYLESITSTEEELDIPPDNKLQLIFLYLDDNNIQRAIEIAHSLNIEELKDYTVIKKLARILIDMEDYRQAFDFLSRSPLDVENKTLINEITLRLERHGELDTAVYLLQFINKHDLVVVEAREREDMELKINTELGLAELHYKNKKWDSALEKYAGILEMGYEDWIPIMERLDEIIKSIEVPPLGYLINLSEFCIRQNNDYKAAGFLNTALEHYPGDLRAQKKLRVIFDRLLSMNPRLPDVRLRSGDLYLDMGEMEKSITEYEQASHFPELLFTAGKRLARAFALSGNYPLSLEKYQTLGEITANDCAHLYNLYEKLLERGILNLAHDALNLIHTYDPEFKDVESLMDNLRRKIKDQGQSLFIDPRMRELIGDHAIGRYKYISKIGSGGMGVVHKVFDIKINCIVAMKILREGLAGSHKAIDRFFREARIAATLNHKNIVKIYDYNISNVYGQSFITMSFVDGVSLRDVIERRFSESLDITMEDICEALYYISQLCEALECTHSHGIIHRDIKPDNIMIDNNRQVKITDFGIVHLEQSSFTPTGALIGTPRYMSPEQVQGGKIDCRSDIYATGIILYELLVGSPPYISGDIAYQQVNIEPTPPAEICPTLPDRVNDIIMKCLKKDPDDRYRSAPELKVDIDQSLERLGGYVPPPPQEEKPKTPEPKELSRDLDLDIEHTG